MLQPTGVLKVPHSGSKDDVSEQDRQPAYSLQLGLLPSPSPSRAGAQTGAKI